jgi:hypothetical protein
VPFFTNLGKNIAHRPGKICHQLMKERLPTTERPAVANRAPEDAPQDIVAVGVARLDAIGDRKAESTNVIGDDTKGHVGGLLASGIESLEGRHVLPHFCRSDFDFVKNRPKDVRLVIETLPQRTGEILLS